MLILPQPGDLPIAYLCGQEPFCRMVENLTIITHIERDKIFIITHRQIISPILTKLDIVPLLESIPVHRLIIT